MPIRKSHLSGKNFELQDKEIEFCKRLGVPEPTTTPDERLQTLMAFRNEWKLYKRKCDSTGKEILSAYSPNSPFKIYSNSIWWGDTWEALDYGRDFDFNRPFFEQFAELQKVVPREGTSVFNSENCDYNGHIRTSKNCYLNSLVAGCEDTMYSYWMVNDKDVLDSMYTHNSTLCYNCSDSENCYSCVMLQESANSNECHFSYQIRGCNNCFFCSNLNNKSYHIFNKPCSKEEFETFKKKYLNGSWKSYQEAYQLFLDIRKKTIRRNLKLINSENCSGEYLYDSKNCSDCFDGHNGEDCSNSISLSDSKDVYSCYSAGWPKCEVAYLSLVSRGSTDIAFCNYTWFSNSLRYCDSCVSSANSFGCVGLRHKKYCILNKQYTKEEYEKLVPKIIEHMKKTGEWGQFFPKNVSPFAYNETAAQDFYPLTREEALKLGHKWLDEDKKNYVPATIAALPDSSGAIDENITKEILVCADCHKNYRIIKQELAFYKKMNLPIPRSCYECRHRTRMNMRNSYKIHSDHCNKCGNEMKTTYPPKHAETVYCEKCYLEAVY